MTVHPTALVDPQAQLHDSVEVGPYSIIGPTVRIGAGTRILSHVHINGDTTIGEDNIIHMGAVLGHEPQDIEYDGSPRSLVIGNRNVIREYASIHRATKEDVPTRVGDGCFIMGFSHIGHDCQVGNGVILANNSMLAGHVHVDDEANIAGGCAVHQFTRIGRCAMLRGLTAVGKDIPPFMIAMGVNRIGGINIVKLRRAGFSADARAEIKAAFRILFRIGNSAPAALRKLKAGNFGAEVGEIIQFMEGSNRGICLRLGKE